MGLSVTPEVTCGIHLPLSQMKRNTGPTYICGWVSKGNASSLTMQQRLGYEVDTRECLDIATIGSTTIKADEVTNQWAYYTGGEGSSSSSKSKEQAAAAPTSQQHQIIQQQQPKRRQPATGGTTRGKQIRQYTPKIAAAASAARQREHASMNVDAECTGYDLFEDEDAMGEDNPGQRSEGDDEDPPHDHSNEAGGEIPTSVPKFKARTRVTNVPHKGKAKHPSFLIEGLRQTVAQASAPDPRARKRLWYQLAFKGTGTGLGRTSGSSWAALYSNWRTTTKTAWMLEDVPLSTHQVSSWTASLNDSSMPSYGRSLPSASKAGMTCDSHTSITTPPHQPTVPHPAPPMSSDLVWLYP